MTTHEPTHQMLAGGPPPPPPITVQALRQAQAKADAEYQQRIAQSHANQRAQQRGDAIDKLEGAAQGVKVLGWFIVVLGFFGGIGMCIYHENMYDGGAHTLVGPGIATVIFSVFAGSVVILLAHWAEAWSEMQR